MEDEYVDDATLQTELEVDESIQHGIDLLPQGVKVIYQQKSRTRLNLVNADERLRLLRLMVLVACYATVESMQADELSTVDFVNNETGEIKRQLVGAHGYNLPGTILELFDHIEQIANELESAIKQHDAHRLLALFKEHGPSMFAREVDEELPPPKSCLVCMQEDAVPESLTPACAHPATACADCLARLDKCSLCRTPYCTKHLDDDDGGGAPADA